MSVPARTVTHWRNTGAVIRGPRAPEYSRVIKALDSTRRLAGVTVTQGSQGATAPGRALRRAVSVAAARNPPGTVVELPCDVPFIRMVLVVPEDDHRPWSYSEAEEMLP